MPNFQGAVNNMLGTAAIALSLNPELKAERQAKLEEKRAQKLEEAYGGAVEEARKVINDPNVADNSLERENAEATVSDYNEKMGEAVEQAFNANPTAKRAQRLVETRRSGMVEAENTKGASREAGEARDWRESAQREGEEQEALAQGIDPETGQPMYVSRDESKMTSSNQRAQKQVKAKASQKRRFKDYLAKMETSLGGTVGDLPAEAQAYIASQYSRKDRKKIMDEEDRKGGKK